VAKMGDRRKGKFGEKETVGLKRYVDQPIMGTRKDSEKRDSFGSVEPENRKFEGEGGFYLGLAFIWKGNPSREKAHGGG